MASESIYGYLRPVSAHVDVAAIAAGWQRLSPVYDVEQWVLPLPPWARRPYAQTGQEAWQRLSHDLTTKPSQEAMCIYLHVPFCSSKCGFCDSYSFKLGTHRQQHVTTYAGLLEQEMTLWSCLGTMVQRPVSTVHFGGGTPSFLGAQAFAQVVQACARHFHTTPATEWALESTVYNLPPDMLAHLHDLGFRRLHIGVQSLEDAVRASIGRRCLAHSVLQKIDEALALGWVVSVDLICGLPGQSVRGFLDGVRTLIDRGVDGFSLYELLIYPQNRRWADGQGLTNRVHLPNYLMFQAGAQYLETHGFRKNLFNHWAVARDDNRYFTFPTRGEDLLALGAIADGVFGDYHYRHGRYHDYRSTLTPGFPGLEGGLARNQAENELRPLVVAILSGHLSDTALATMRDLLGMEGVKLLELWQRCGLLAHEANSTGLSLTPSGSWFAGNMLLQLEETTAR
jgi:coproporphyrinogen III oxidase-like Fe-S oxidoreductase